MDYLIYLALGLFSLLILGLIFLYAWFAITAYQLKRKVTKMIENEGKDLIGRGIEGGISKFQEKLNEELKKNKK